MNDTQKVGASYLYGFHIEAQNLLVYQAQYENLIKELEQRKDDIGPEQRAILVQLIQTLRQEVKKTYIKYVSIRCSMEENPKIPPDFDKAYKHILNNFIYNRDQVDIYVLELHKFLAKESVRTLMENSESLVQSITQ